MPLVEKLKELGITLEDLKTSDAKQLQTELAPVLRIAAIQYLQSGDGPVAKGFRDSYRAIAGVGEKHAIGSQKTIQDYLDTQAKDTVFGTYVEAAALGELLGCHVYVTPVRNRTEQEEICIHKVEPKKNQVTPAIHLYCVNNNHWYIDKRHPKATLMDGNCLYNAFVQALRDILIVKPQQEANSAIAYRLRSHRGTMFAQQHQSEVENKAYHRYRFT